MANYAVIKDGIVNNVIVADTKEIAETVTGLTCVEVEHVPGSPGIGWSYDGAEFTAPVVEESNE
jgi:hypothetical protein